MAGDVLAVPMMVGGTWVVTVAVEPPVVTAPDAPTTPPLPQTWPPQLKALWRKVDAAAVPILTQAFMETMCC